MTKIADCMSRFCLLLKSQICFLEVTFLKNEIVRPLLERHQERNLSLFVCKFGEKERSTYREDLYQIGHDEYFLYYNQCIVYVQFFLITVLIVGNNKYFLKCLFFLDVLKWLAELRCRSSKNNIKYLFVMLSSEQLFWWEWPSPLRLAQLAFVTQSRGEENTKC